jgi:hypothetical protein
MPGLALTAVVEVWIRLQTGCGDPVCAILVAAERVARCILFHDCG